MWGDGEMLIDRLKGENTFVLADLFCAVISSKFALKVVQWALPIASKILDHSTDLSHGPTGSGSSLFRGITAIKRNISKFSSIKFHKRHLSTAVVPRNRLDP